MVWTDIANFLFLALMPFVIAAVVTVLVVHFRRISSNKLGQSKVRPVLSRFCTVRRYKILHNVEITLKERTVTVPFIVVGIFGILIVTTIEDYANIYGNADDKRWVADNEKKHNRWYIPNWVKVNEEIVEFIRKGLSNRDIYRIQIDAISVFAHANKELSVSNTLPVIRASRFGRYLNKERFNTENKIDMDKMAQAVVDIATGK